MWKIHCKVMGFLAVKVELNNRSLFPDFPTRKPPPNLSDDFRTTEFYWKVYFVIFAPSFIIFLDFASYKFNEWTFLLCEIKKASVI